MLCSSCRLIFHVETDAKENIWTGLIQLCFIKLVDGILPRVFVFQKYGIIMKHIPSSFHQA